jgi:membrane dipeptidase
MQSDQRLRLEIPSSALGGYHAIMSQTLKRIAADSIVWDNHGCMPIRAEANFLPQLERYRNAGVNIASLNIGFADIPWTEHLRVISFMRQWITQRPETYRLISTVEDVRRAKAEGKLGITFDIEGMCPVQNDLSLVQTFYELGVRWMLIAYNRNNLAGGGCLDEDSGLTATGRAIIDEMERVGMVLCLSHAGGRTVAEALEYSRNPTIFSHSNPYGDEPHPRNVSDEVMRACARKGGVIGLSGIGPFLGASDNLVERLLRQLRYVIDLVGAEHVGLGLDYVFDRAELDEYVRNNPSIFPPTANMTGGMPMIEPEAMSAIAEGLAKDNLTDAQIRGILGENWLRIATQVWR